MLHLETLDSETPVYLATGRGGEVVAEGGDGRTLPGPAQPGGGLPHNGRGVERDTTEAIRWYLMAAEDYNPEDWEGVREE